MNHKLNILLNSLSDKEIREFRKFVQSPLFSGRRNYLPLLDSVLKFRKKVFKGLYSKNANMEMNGFSHFKSQTLRNRLSELFKIGEEFIIYKDLHNEADHREIVLLQALKKRDMEAIYSNLLKRLIGSISELPYSDEAATNKFVVERMYLELLQGSTNGESRFTKYFEHSEFVTALALLNLFLFGIELLQQEQANRKYEFNLPLEVLENLDFEKISLKLRKSDRMLMRIVCMLYYFYRMFKNPDDELSYFEGRKLFDEVYDHLSHTYKMEIYKLMTHYCIIRQNEGVKKFQKEIFSLYNERLKKNMYQDENTGDFQVSSFRNYVLIGLILKKYKWTENFIKKYSRELPEKNREYEIRISLSKVYFSNRDYEKAMDLIEGFKGITYMHYCDSSILRLCIFYEVGKYEDAFREWDKFRQYLKNHLKVPAAVKEYMDNFLKLYMKLLKIKTSTEQKNASLLFHEFKKIKLISRRDWLEEKLNELIK